MSEQNISLWNAVAWALWVLAAVGVTIGLFVEAGVGRAGLLAGAAAATLHTRDNICKHGRLMRAAYNLGREDERLERVPVQRIR